MDDTTPPLPGEFGLIRWIRDRERTAGRGNMTILGIGDDCAILEPTSGSRLLVTADMLMDGRHFQLETDGAEAVGYKAMGVNISDIAAMAGVPRAAVVSVALPRAEAATVARGLHAGLRRMADRFGVDLVGGDTNAWDGPLVINVTLLGETTARGPVLRSGASPGDVICVTGPLGGSLLRGRHLRPEPRVREALVLHEAVPIRAMIDISDGLSSDLGHILEESGGLGAMLDLDLIPIHDDARAASAEDGKAAYVHALNDGEDFELCVVLDRRDARSLGALTGLHHMVPIGEITAEPGLQLRLHDGTLEPLTPSGFDHLRGAEG